MTVSLISSRITGHQRPRAVALGRYFQVWKERRELHRLSDAMLRDLGISRAQATREAARSLWDIAPK